MNRELLLSVKDLAVEFRTGHTVVNAVNGVSFDVHQGETLAILGESGSGKSITFEAVLGILDAPPGIVTSGQAIFENKDLLQLPAKQQRAICGNKIGMIFQDPLSALNPVYTAGWQIAEMLRVHLGIDAGRAAARSVELLELVGIPDASIRAKNYPHEFSGGMRQRLVIAMALAAEPLLVIADEPTTALDVTIEAQILSLLKSLQRDKGLGLIIITHSMGVVAEIADRVCVMYAGRIVETASVETLFESPSHPYTVGLLNSNPYSMSGKRLTPISGQPPDLADIPTGCPFHSRCSFAKNECYSENPPLENIPSGDSHTHQIACHFSNEVRSQSKRVLKS